LFKAGPHDELLHLQASERRLIWEDLIWDACMPAARGQIDEAIAYLIERQGM
jgi:hypothetical protein